MKNPIEYLYFRTRYNGGAVATQRLGGGLSNAQFLAMVRGIACKLRNAGVGPRQLVVTCLKNPHTDWILTLALMHEAVVTCSNHGYTPLPAGLSPDLVITERVMPDVPAGSQLVIDEAWLRELPAVPGDFAAQRYEADDSLFRVVLTSGTTGQSKMVGLTLAQFLGNCAHNFSPTGGPSRTFCFLALSTQLGFKEAFIRYLWGAPFYYALSYQEAINLVDAFQIECITGSPIQIAGLVEELQRTSRRLTSLKNIYYGGGEASPSLINSMRRDLCTNVTCAYGSTEAGSTARFLVQDPDLQPGMVGYVVPEAEVQIVGADQEVLETGEEGLIRIRSTYMVQGYYNNPEETKRCFRDGWFYPGDRGRLLANGALVLAGRASELINRGGIKIDPAELDRCLQDCPGVKDAAAFSFENLQNTEDVCMALVVEDGFDFDALRSRVARMLGRDRSPAVFLRVQEIPRNQMGKPQRKQMREQLGENLRQILRRQGTAGQA
ncbi:MAG TPA: fatty acid--CoA ligase family protein [Holophaga sp.]|nr:fatty acid--CoA ligase family protein [Holophaga sp.]